MREKMTKAALLNFCKMRFVAAAVVLFVIDGAVTAIFFLFCRMSNCVSVGMKKLVKYFNLDISGGIEDKQKASEDGSQAILNAFVPCCFSERHSPAIFDKVSGLNSICNSIAFN
jgi:hypothetical protein